MKNIFKLIGIVALVAVIGFSFAACSDGGSGGGGGGGGGGISALLGKWYGSQEEADEVGAAAAAGKLYSQNEYMSLSSSGTLPEGAVADIPVYEFASNGKLFIGGQGSVMGIEFTYEATADKIRATGSWVSYTIIGTVLTIVGDESGLTQGKYYKPGKDGGKNNGWTAVTNSPFDKSGIYAIAYGNNKFVAGGSGGKMATSTDGVTWTAVPNSPFDERSSIYTIAYGNGKFVAGGAAYGKMVTSTDGVTWTAVANSKFTNRGDTSIRAIAYGNGKFVAGGSNTLGTNMTYSSDNGETWTEATSAGQYDFGYGIKSIAFGNGKFIAGSSDGKMVTSTDGATWTAVDIDIFKSSYFGVEINAIAFDNSKFVAVGKEGKIATSTDGITWTAVSSSPFGSKEINALAYGNNKFVAGASGKMAYSTNGTSWTAVSYNPFGTSGSTAIAYGSGKFVAGSNDGRIAYSTDGGTGTGGGGDITPSGTPPTITTTSLPNGTAGTVYNKTLTASGDTPITWSIDSGALPAGLTLSPEGVISGTPTTAGTSTFTVKATNSKGSKTQQLSITIAASSSGGNNNLNGTWRDSDGETLTLNNGDFQASVNNTGVMKGTYTVSGSTITLVVVELHGDVLNEAWEEVLDTTFESKWYNKDQLIDVFIVWARGDAELDDDVVLEILNQYFDFDEMFPTFTGTINGNNTIIIDFEDEEEGPTTYTKDS